MKVKKRKVLRITSGLFLLVGVLFFPVNKTILLVCSGVAAFLLIYSYKFPKPILTTKISYVNDNTKWLLFVVIILIGIISYITFLTGIEEAQPIRECNEYYTRAFENLEDAIVQVGAPDCIKQITQDPYYYLSEGDHHYYVVCKVC